MSLVFVFGSNARGEHAGGAARTAYDKYGAVWGVGHGTTGDAYAIDTMSGWDELVSGVARFIEWARMTPDKSYYVTPIGCGIAGYKPQDVAPLFKDAPFNVALCMELANNMKE